MVCFTELRNCIVHEEGVIYSDSKNIKRIEAFDKLKSAGFISLKVTTGIKRTRYEVIIEGKHFLEDSVNKIEEFLQELDKLLQSHY
jgi:predicted transcriptional regulator